MTKQEKVGLLGLGAMGARLARRLLEAGHRVTVWNRSPGPEEELLGLGAEAAKTPSEAARGAAFVLSMVRDDAASRAVWQGPEGALRSLAPGALAVELSTLTPTWTRRLAMAVQDVGGVFVESPVVGSRPQAEGGQLVALAAGPRDGVDRLRPLLAACCGRIFFLGEAGLGATAKLAVNAFFAVQVAAAGELVSFLRAGGIEDERWLDLIGQLPVVAPPLAASFGAMARREFAPQFPVELVAKDLGYFVAAADGAARSSPVRAAAALYRQAIEQGLGDLNLTAIVEIFQGAEATMGEAAVSEDRTVGGRMP